MGLPLANYSRKPEGDDKANTCTCNHGATSTSNNSSSSNSNTNNGNDGNGNNNTTAPRAARAVTPARMYTNYTDGAATIAAAAAARGENPLVRLFPTDEGGYRYCHHGFCDGCTVVDVVTVSWRCCRCAGVTLAAYDKPDQDKIWICEKVHYATEEAEVE